MPKKEPKPVRKMKIVRSWFPDESVFRYFKIYSDGKIEPATRKDGEQFAHAYGVAIETIVGEPKEGRWIQI